VEVAAVLGLVLLGYNLLQAIGNLERETADAAALANQQRMAGIPTIAPTPVVRLAQVVLPGGHTPPGSPGGVQFNFAEIPGHLLARVQDEILQPVLFRPPPTDETALRVVIPQISVDWTIVQGVDWEALKAGVGQVVNGVDPGDPTGNVVLAGHNDVYGEAFRELDQLQPGDQFQIITATRAYTYVVTGWDIYLPSDVHVMDNRVGATATLISCYPYRVSDKRIVVFADRVDS
jgi:sortase A